MDDTAYKLAYEEAVRALSEQQSALQGFRTNAGILLSAAAIATSFLGGAALADGRFSGWSWAAVLLFAGVAAVVFAILWPLRSWEFVASPHDLIATYVEAERPLPLARIHRDLALHMEQSHDANAWRLERIVWLSRAAIVLLAAETFSWIVDLIIRR